jgi:hypothetical protein
MLLTVIHITHLQKVTQTPKAQLLGLTGRIIKKDKTGYEVGILIVVRTGFEPVLDPSLTDGFSNHAFLLHLTILF